MAAEWTTSSKTSYATDFNLLIGNGEDLLQGDGVSTIVIITSPVYTQWDNLNKS